MKTYRFKFKNSDDILSTGKFECYEDALEFFSKQKKLSIDSFLQIFEILN